MINALIAAGIIEDFRPKPILESEKLRRYSEYELIKMKRSKLPANERSMIMRWVERQKG